MRKKKLKLSPTDYSLSSLPTTRKELFRDIYHNSFRKIFSCGCVLLLFSLPLLGFLLFMDIGQFGLTSDTYPDEDTLNQMVFLWDVYDHLGMAVFLNVLLVGVSGVMRILKKILWQEGVFFWHDFGEGVKENYRSMSVITVILTTLHFLTFLVSDLFIDSLWSLAPLGLFAIFLVPMYFWHLELASVYRAKFGEYLKNAFFFETKTYPMSLLFTIGFVFPFLVNYIPVGISVPYLYVKYAVLAALLVFYYPFLIVVFSLYSHGKFDEYINRENYPEYYRKGLYDLNAPEGDKTKK